MRKIAKNIIALSISSALSISFISSINAATYQLVDTGEDSTARYTYAQQQNMSGDIAISGSDIYNFPVQYEYFTEADFDSIEIYAAYNHSSIHSLENIEDSVALRSGSPTANDLAWVVRWLQDTSSGTGNNIEYQKVGGSIAMAKVDGVTRSFNLWDTNFEGSQDISRSTVNILTGITNTGISFGSATAPYLPSETFIDDSEVEHIYWLREHGLRGFFSYDNGARVHEITPFETEYGGGISAVMDVNDAGIAVGFSSFELVPGYAEFIESDSGGCADPDIVPSTKSLEACIAETQISTTSIYNSMAFKATLSSSGTAVIDRLGLLVTPHEDDERSYSSYALAVNSSGNAVGYADGFYDETVTVY